MVKISELKLDRVRKVINFLNKNNIKDSITIYNVNEDTKNTIVEMIKDHTDDNGDMTISGEDMLRFLFPLLTDIEIDDEAIEHIVANPSKELILVNSEIFTIINEINMELVLDQNLEYERLLLLSEQMRGINMIAYIKERMSRMTPLRDYDPLNTEALEDRNKREMDEISESFNKVKEIYEEALVSDKLEAEIDG